MTRIESAYLHFTKRGETMGQADPADDVPIVYGYPSPATLAAAKRGEIILGGCVIPDSYQRADSPESPGSDDPLQAEQPGFPWRG